MVVCACMCVRKFQPSRVVRMPGMASLGWPPGHEVEAHGKGMACGGMVCADLALLTSSWAHPSCPVQHKTRDIMEKAGLPTPRHFRISQVGRERPSLKGKNTPALPHAAVQPTAVCSAWHTRSPQTWPLLPSTSASPPSSSPSAALPPLA